MKRHAPEATSWLQLRCWRNNSMNSSLSPGEFNRRVLRSCLVWQCSHQIDSLIDSAINALRIVTDYMRRTPADNLPILAVIQPSELRCKGSTLSLACSAMEPGHLLHSVLTCPSSANARRFKIETPICTRRTTTHNFI